MMAIVLVKTDKVKCVEDFMSEVNDRLTVADLVKNPFTGRVKSAYVGAELYSLVSITPLWPPAYLFGLIIAMIGLILGVTWLLVAGLVFYVIIGFVWTPLFYALMLRAGLRRNGYKGKVRFFGLKKACEVFVYGSD